MATVQRPQHFKCHRDAIRVQSLPQFILVRGHNILRVTQQEASGHYRDNQMLGGVYQEIVYEAEVV